MSKDFEKKSPTFFKQKSSVHNFDDLPTSRSIEKPYIDLPDHKELMKKKSNPFPLIKKDDTPKKVKIDEKTPKKIF